MRRSIRFTLTVAFVSLAIGPLLLVGIALVWQTFVVQQQQALVLQRTMAQNASVQVTAFFHELENELTFTSQMQGLAKLPQDSQSKMLSQMLTSQPVFNRLILLNRQGQAKVNVSRIDANPTTLVDYSKSDEFITPLSNGDLYYSPVRFDATSGEPLITMTVPLVDPQSGQIISLLMAEVRIKTIWDLIANIEVGPGQNVYIVDAKDRVIADRNPSVVLSNKTFHAPEQDGIYPSLTGSNAFISVSKTQFGNQVFIVVVEQQWADALALALNSVYIIIVVILIALILSSIAGLLVVRQIVRPIQSLTTTAQAISSTGDLSQRVLVMSNNEIGSLAKIFNNMTSQLADFVGTLEQRVEERTKTLSRQAIQLQAATEVARAVSSVLDANELIQKAVNLVHSRFDLYYVGLFLLDEQQQFAVLHAGTGDAGIQMQASDHKLEINDSSMIGSCISHKEPRIMLNANEQAAYFKNPLLPNTHSELALPLMSQGQVIGAMTIQSEQVAAFSPEDISILQSMADQLANGIEKARLYEQIQQRATELDKAREIADNAKIDAEKARIAAEEATQNLAAQMWQAAGQTGLNDKMRGEQDMTTLANNIIQHLCKYLQVENGAIYILEDKILQLAGTYAYRQKSLEPQYQIGEDQVGQAALEKELLIYKIPDEYIATSLRFGKILPKFRLIAPIIYNQQVRGVVALESMTEFTTHQKNFVEQVSESMAIAFITVHARARANELASQTHHQAEEIQAQEEE